ncbi:MAG: hypothetical protein BWY06_02409 [Candidatus Latescibacteria bacterium ADurb.Bin168]|nr:MAG: hypothetical protein BWY06_02409 [Candidatus Latescibacteria bacterium ADurb.Bin168]
MYWPLTAIFPPHFRPLIGQDPRTAGAAGLVTSAVMKWASFPMGT